MAIRLDFSQHSVVIVCDKCPEWRAVRSDKLTAWAAAAAHEKDAHEGQRQASLAYGMARRRELQANLEKQAAKLTEYQART